MTERTRAWCPTWIAESFDISDVVALAITSATRITESARAVIPENVAMIWFHTKLEAQPGELVYFLPDGEDDTVITTYDVGAKGRVLGVYLAHEAVGSRFLKPA